MNSAEVAQWQSNCFVNSRFGGSSPLLGSCPVIQLPVFSKKTPKALEVDIRGLTRIFEKVK